MEKKSNGFDNHLQKPGKNSNKKPATPKLPTAKKIISHNKPTKIGLTVKDSEKVARTQSYNLEVERLTNYKNILEKEGYTFKNNPIDETPKTVTKKNLNDIKKVTIGDIAKKGQSSLQADYNKARSRITSAVKRAEKMGLTFNGDIVPEKPEYITQDYIDYLNSINTRQIKYKGVWIDPETNEVKGYKELRQYKRKLNELAKKEAEFQPTSEAKHLIEIDEESTPLKAEHTLTELDDIPLPTEYEDKTLTKVTDNLFVDEDGVVFENENGFIPAFATPFDDDTYVQFDEHIIEEYRGYLNGLPDVFKVPITQYFDNLLRIFGVNAMAQALQNIDQDVWDIYERYTMTYSEVVQAYTQLLTDFIPPIEEGYEVYLNGIELTKDVLKNNVDFLTQYEFEDLENVL